MRVRHLQLGVMSAVVGHNGKCRPLAADVRPGTEPYERVIRALRGESWNRAFGATRTEEKPQPPFTAKAPVYTSTPLSTPNTRFLRNVSTSDSPCTVATAPSAKRARCSDEDTEQLPTRATTNNVIPSVSIDHASSEDPFEQFVTGPVNPTDNQNTIPPQPVTISCSRLTEKLQKIAQLDDEVQSIKVSQPRAKYKPPYKIIVDSRPGM